MGLILGILPYVAIEVFEDFDGFDRSQYHIISGYQEDDGQGDFQPLFVIRVEPD